MVPIDPARAMKDRLRSDLKLALAARHRAEAAVVRALIAAIDNHEAPPLPDRHAAQSGCSGPTEVARLSLDAETVRAILLEEIAERESAAARIESAGAADRAKALRAEVLLIRRYLD